MRSPGSFHFWINADNNVSQRTPEPIKYMYRNASRNVLNLNDTQNLKFMESSGSYMDLWNNVLPEAQWIGTLSTKPILMLYYFDGDGRHENRGFP